MPAALSHWDEMLASSKQVDSLALSFWQEERPLQGVAGLVDWRLCGGLSRLITAGHASGEADDSIMMLAGPQLPFVKVFLFGLGPEPKMNDFDYIATSLKVRDVLSRAGVHSYALQLPGRATGLIAPRRAAQLWQEMDGAEDEQVIIVDTKEACKEIAEHLDF